MEEKGYILSVSLCSEVVIADDWRRRICEFKGVMETLRLLWLNWRDIKHPWAGGAEIHLHEIARRLAKDGYDISVLTSHINNLPAVEWIDGYKVIRIGGHETYPYAVWRSLRRFAKDSDMIIEDINLVPIYAPLLLRPAKKMLAIVHHLVQRIYFDELPLWKASIAYTLETMMPYVYSRVFNVPILSLIHI